MDARAHVRHAVRVLLLDEHDRVLLFRAQNPETGVVFWFSPGGGLEPDEDAPSAALRELHEETGRSDVELQAEVWHRRHIFTWRGTRYDQRERWFLARVEHFEPDFAGMTESERIYVSAWRWWTIEDLRATADELAPRELASHLSDLLRDGPPIHPTDVGA